jgi:hypothetical protein
MPDRKPRGGSAKALLKQADACRKQSRQTSDPIARQVYADLGDDLERKAKDIRAERERRRKAGG